MKNNMLGNYEKDKFISTQIPQSNDTFCTYIYLNYPTIYL